MYLLLIIPFLFLMLALPFVLPILKTLYWARNAGVNLSLEQAAGMAIRKVGSKEFFIAVKGIQDCYDVPIEDLETHFLAGGNMINLMKGIQLMHKKKGPLHFRQLSALNLVERDLIVEINKAEQKGWVFFENWKDDG